MIVIVGESASGKTTLANNLAAHDGKYKKIVTYTTRPKRDGERDGVDYHFVTESTFEELSKRQFFAEVNQYRNWKYGTAIADCVDTNETVAVLTPAGLRALKKQGVKTLSVYLYTDRRSRLVQCLNRGDDIEEAYRRSLSDVGQFDGVESEVDYIIDNNNFHMKQNDTLRCLLQIIHDHEEKANAVSETN